jgi:predicted porin
MVKMKITKLKAPALAVASLTATTCASADASLKLEGNADEGYKSITHSDSAKNKEEFIASNASTSAAFFKGTKDLGRNFNAYFQMGIDYNTTQTSANNGTAAPNA